MGFYLYIFLAEILPGFFNLYIWGAFQINLNFEYNLLHLLHNVREGGTIIAGYEYGYGGGKLKVSGRDGSGYAYVGKSGLPGYG